MPSRGERVAQRRSEEKGTSSASCSRSSSGRFVISSYEPRPARRPLPDLARSEAGLSAGGQALDQAKAGPCGKSVAHGGMRSGRAGIGMPVAPPLRDTIPVSGDRQMLDAVLDAAASLIVVADPHGTFVRWNRACEQLGLDGGRASGAAGAARPGAERRAADARGSAGGARRGESPVRAEFHWRTRDGELRLIEWSNTALTGRTTAPSRTWWHGHRRDRDAGRRAGGRRGAAAPHGRPRRASPASTTGAASSRSSTAISCTAAATGWTGRCWCSTSTASSR